MGNKRVMLVGLVACVLIAINMITSALNRFHTREFQQNHQSPEDFSLPCLVLTLNESNIDPSAKKCTSFVAPSFTEV